MERAEIIYRAVAPPSTQNLCAGEKCVDCPKGHVPGGVFRSSDGKLRCFGHYARHRSPRWDGAPRLSAGFMERHGLGVSPSEQR